MWVLTLNIQVCRHLQDICQCFMHNFTSDLFLIIMAADRKFDNGDSGSRFLVDFFSAPFPSLSSKVPLKPWWRVTPSSMTLNLYFSSRSGHERTGKRWRISRDSQVDRSRRSWKFYSWALRTGLIWSVVQNGKIVQFHRNIFGKHIFLIFIVHTTQKLKLVMLDSHLQIIIFKTGHLMNDNVFEHPFLIFLKKSTLIVKVHTIFRTFLHIINQLWRYNSKWNVALFLIS